MTGLVSAPVWGRYADASSKVVIICAALITSAIGETPWFLPVAYFILSLAHSGVRVRRKTYVVNLASGNQRTDYVAISNTIIGVLLLFVGAVGALTPVVGNDGVIGLLALMGLAGAVYGITLTRVAA